MPRANAEIEPFGAVHRDLVGKPQEALGRLLAARDGEAIGALSHPQVSEPVDLIHGEAPAPGREGFGLAKIAAKHAEVLADLQAFLSRLKLDEAKSGARRKSSA